jgi:hypothetical protein
MTSTTHDYRIISRTNPKEILEYAVTSDQAVDIAAKVDGVVQCYVYGYGWVRWDEAMKERQR